MQSVAGFNPSQSLWNRAVSFDCTRFEVLRDSEVSIPLEQGSVFRQQINLLSQQQKGLNPFGTGQCLSTTSTIMVFKRSIVSIPLEQGSVFRLILETGLLLAENVSIPLEQGSVFRQLVMTWNVFIKISLNPFGTGQCLSTVDNIPPASELSVSIPLEQGSVFRHTH